MQDVVLIRKSGEVIDLNTNTRMVKSIRRDATWQEVQRVTLELSTHEPFEFEREDKIVWLDREWIYFSFVEQTEIVHEGKMNYTVPFYSPDKYLEDTEMRDTDVDMVYTEGNEDPPMCGDIEHLIKVICNNVKRNNEGRMIFKLGEFPLTKMKYVEFTDINCLSCLGQICKEFDTFYTIRKNTGGDSEYIIDIGKEVGTFPITLSYGQDNGLYKLTRRAIDTKSVVTKLLVLGSDKNLPISCQYPRLRLPDRYPLSVISDPAKIAKYGHVEGRYESEIHPTRLGIISEIDPVDLRSFIDNNMDFDPVKSNVAMMSGAMAGYQLEVTKAVEIAPKKWKITVAEFTNNNGYTVPNEFVHFGVGDEYHLIDFPMPNSYYEAAREGLADEGERAYLKVSQPQVEYETELDPLELQEIGVEIEVGMKVHIKDVRVGVDKEVRIVSFSQTNPFKYESVRISDFYGDTYDTAVYKTVVRSADKIKFAGLTNPADSPSSSFLKLQNSIAQKFGYKDWKMMIGNLGNEETIIDPDLGLIRAKLIDVFALIAEIAVIGSLKVKYLETDISTTELRTSLFNYENILKFQRYMSGIIAPGECVKIGYGVDLATGDFFPPQLLIASGLISQYQHGLPEKWGCNVQQNGIFIGTCSASNPESITDEYAILGMVYDGSQRRASLILKNLVSGSSFSGPSGLVWRYSVLNTNSLYCVP
jgi:hypothetical protein